MRKQIYFFLVGIAVMMLLISCGKEEEQQQEVGIDGYVNLSNQVSLDDVMASCTTWKEAGGKLYYPVDNCIYDVPVAQALELQMTQEVNVTDIGDEIRRFCVDGDGNIYWEPTSQTKERYLHKHLAKSGEDIQIPLALGNEVIKSFVAGPNGRIYLLLDKEILELDGEGTVVSRYSGEQFRFRTDGSGSSENLMADSQGNLFYLQSVVQDTRIKVLYQGTREWVELTSLPEAFGTMDFFLTGEGKIFINADDALYEYDLENAKSTAVLRFSESNLDKNNIQNIIYVDEEHFLTICMSMGTKMETEMYLLTRTPIEEVPQKTVIVLASLSPSQALSAAVAEFNRMSEEYTVVINRYGTEGMDDGYEVFQAAKIRLDSSLVSSDPPDLLDMDFYMLDVATYAEKDVLADLYPYFEKSDVLDIEDYLENVVEGYTVNGKLVCLPIKVLPQMIIGRTSQVGSDMGWTFEDLNAVLEKYPNKKLLARNFMLYYFLYDYYVNTFIDPDTGECSFDSDEFREFILWTERNKLPDEEVRSFDSDYVPEDVLLDYQSFRDFVEFSRQKLRFGEDITFIGNVTMAGTPSFMYQSNGKVGIVERSKYKDGAWAFLEYFISSKGSFQGNFQFGFPTNRKELMKMAGEAMQEKKEMTLSDGSVVKIYGYRALGDVRAVPIHAPTWTEIQSVLEVIENIDFTQVSTTPSLDGLARILREELEPYDNGQKSLEEVTRIFNSRIQLMVSEGM